MDMNDGPVVVQPVRDPMEAAGQIYQGINISDSTAHLGPAYISHHHHYDDEDRRRILDELSSLHYPQVHRRIQLDRLTNTGSSLLDSDEYLQWRDEAVGDGTCTHSLWCSGPPGVGKTFLASNVIDELYGRIEGRRYALLYLYANRDRSFEQSPASFLCHLAGQLVEALPEADMALGLKAARSHNRLKDRHSLPAILGLAQQLVLRFDRIYVVLDALDEFSEDPDDRLRLIEALLALQRVGGPGAIRLCIFSRQSHTCEGQLRPQWTADVTSAPEDLRIFIKNRIERSSRLTSLCRGSSYLQDEIAETVLEKCEGVFKVASLQMEVVAKQINRAGIIAALETLSSQAEVYYKQALKRIRKKDDFGPTIVRMLGWLLTLREPLLDEELAQAMGMAEDTPLQTFPSDLEVHLPTLIGMAEGLLVSYPAKSQPITFAHQTVRTFLHSELVQSGLTDWNADIARTYMRYICLSRSVSALDESCREEFDWRAARSTSMGWYDLLRKAARTWPTYASAANEDVSASERDLITNCRGSVVFCCFYGWASIARLLATSQLANPCETIYDFYSPLHVAISSGHHDAVKALLEAAYLDVNRRGIGANGTIPVYEKPWFFSGFEAVNFNWCVDEFARVRNEVCKRTFRWRTHHVLRRQLAGDRLQEELQASRSIEDLQERIDQAASTAPFTNAYVIQAFGTPPLHLAVDGRRRERKDADPLQPLVQRHEDIMLKLFFERDDVDVNSVGFAGLTPLFIAIHNADVEAVLALLGCRDIDVNLATRSDHALSFTVHRMCFQRFVAPEKSLILGALIEEDSGVFTRLLLILEILLAHPTMDVHQPDVLGYTAMDWLDFYRNISVNDALRAFVDSDRDWVGDVGRETAAMVLKFYEKCQFPFEEVATALDARGALSSRTVELDHWLTWFCPLPQRVYDDDADSEVRRKREEEGNVDEIYLLRVPFEDGFETVHDALSEGSSGVNDDRRSIARSDSSITTDGSTALSMRSTRLEYGAI